MDYPQLNLKGLFLEVSFEVPICAGLVLIKDNLIEKDNSFNNYKENFRLVSEKKGQIAFSNSFLLDVIKYWEEHNSPPTVHVIREKFERSGDEVGLAFLRGLVERIVTQGRGSTSPAAMIGYLEAAAKETGMQYIKRALQNAVEIYLTGKSFGDKGKTIRLEGESDFISYAMASLIQMPKASNCNSKGDLYLTAEPANYIAYPSFTIGATGILCGSSDVGKTNGILCNINKCHVGDKLFGRLDIMKECDIHLYTELSDSDVKERLTSFNIIPDRGRVKIFHRHEFGFIKDYREFLSMYVKKGERPILIFFDNISSWFSIDLNKDKEVSEYHDFVRMLAFNTGNSIQTLCHSRKRSNSARDRGEATLDDIAGSRLVFSLASNVTFFDNVLDEKKRVVKSWGQINYYKRKSVDTVYYFINEVQGCIEYHNELPAGLLGEDTDVSDDLKALQFIQSSPKPATVVEVAVAIGKSKSTAKRLIRSLMDSDQIFRHGDENSPKCCYDLVSEKSKVALEIPLEMQLMNNLPE